MQHYPGNCVEISAWCQSCYKDTPHRVDAPKLGPCLTCLEKLNQRDFPFVPKEPEQEELFPK